MNNVFDQAVSKIALKHTFGKLYIELLGFIIFGIGFYIFIITHDIDFHAVQVFYPVFSISIMLLLIKVFFINMKVLKNYSITFNDNIITINNRTIYFDQIESIKIKRNKDILIYTDKAYYLIYKNIKNYAYISNELKKTYKLEPVENETKVKVIQIIGIISLPLFIFLKVPFIVIPLGLVTLIVLIPGTIQMLKIKGLWFLCFINLLAVLFVIVKLKNYFFYIFKI